MSSGSGVAERIERAPEGARPGSLVPWAVALGLAGVGIGLVLGLGWTEEAFLGAIRGSARAGFALFAALFALTPLARGSAAHARRRHALALGLVTSHGIHYALIVGRAFFYPTPFLDGLRPVQTIGGFGAYGLMVVLALWPYRRAGAAPLARIERVAEAVIWAFFFFAYLPRVPLQPVYVLPPLVLLAALAPRFVRRDPAG